MTDSQKSKKEEWDDKLKEAILNIKDTEILKNNNLIAGILKKEGYTKIDGTKITHQKVRILMASMEDSKESDQKKELSPKLVEKNIMSKITEEEYREEADISRSKLVIKGSDKTQADIDEIQLLDEYIKKSIWKGENRISYEEFRSQKVASLFGKGPYAIKIQKIKKIRLKL